MKREPWTRMLAAAAGLVLVLCASPEVAGAGQSRSPAGEWIGRLDFGSQPGLIRIAVHGSAQEGWTASVILQPIAAVSTNNPEARRILESWRDAPLALDGASWSLVAGAAPHAIRIEVRPSDRASTAAVTYGTQSWRIVLHHLAPVEISRERQYAGTYVLRSGDRIYVWRPSDSGPIVGGLRRADGFLTYLEEKTGRSGSLFPVSSDSYVAGPSSVLPEPVRVRAAFREGPQGWRLLWQPAGQSEMIATRSTAYRRETISLKGPGGVLGCDLLVPVHDGRHPAAVLVPGAGAQDRHSVDMIAQLFAEHGVAALACDKRGTGASEGDWRLISFEQQAEDVVAGVRFLRQRPEVDASNVGVWGLSEGAWVAPLAAVTDGRLAFVMLAALPATSRRTSLIVSGTDRLRREGVSETEIARHAEFQNVYQQAIIDRDVAAIEQLWRQYAGATWLPANKPTAQALNDASWERARLTWPYEPGPVLARITSPLLAIWGADDQAFPSRVHAPLLEQAMRAARNSGYTIQIIPNAIHSFRSVAPSFAEDIGYAPEYLNTLVDWLTRTVKKR